MINAAPRHLLALRMALVTVGVCSVLAVGAPAALAGTFTYALESDSPLPPAAAWYRGCIQNATRAELVMVVDAMGEPDIETSNPDGTRNACWNDLYNDGSGSRFNRWVQAAGVTARLDLAIVVDLRMGWNPFAYSQASGIEFAPTMTSVPAGWRFSVGLGERLRQLLPRVDNVPRRLLQPAGWRLLRARLCVRGRNA